MTNSTALCRQLPPAHRLRAGTSRRGRHNPDVGIIVVAEARGEVTDLLAGCPHSAFYRPRRELVPLPRVEQGFVAAVPCDLG
jgi:hypothetical protein